MCIFRGSSTGYRGFEGESMLWLLDSAFTHQLPDNVRKNDISGRIIPLPSSKNLLMNPKIPNVTKVEHSSINLFSTQGHQVRKLENG